MDRENLKCLIENYRTPFEEEKAMVPGFLELLNDPDAFKRERKAGHFTASAWIVNKRRTHALLTLHRKLQRWLQLGGHADGNENLLEVALKEAQEESGLQSIRLVDKSIFDLDRHVIPANDKEERHFHYDVRFLIEAEMDEPLIISPESKDLAWVGFDLTAELVGFNDSVLRMLEKTSKSEILL
ncbi:NUDIX hydrolase [Cyclobacterium sp. 1_MG-2023]|uniref:NUDIX hydrolase n=1 Tax=Cyclobacterium sp. 1_MG-2023 TaxID=3062681 RepID=UPI0026E1BBC6|nr:NUDIX hydrolase [Cyclobacterium sp. 1_MG-2023]MDO6436295.1 NUDIX hydrolase [Cyclobacterium sp. 1_MG-2023]|tara:strand:+ start:227 stop:778 length:552 start_codon:yes stop_codon:yes gene_type:complete